MKHEEEQQVLARSGPVNKYKLVVATANAQARLLSDAVRAAAPDHPNPARLAARLLQEFQARGIRVEIPIASVVDAGRPDHG